MTSPITEEELRQYIDKTDLDTCLKRLADTPQSDRRKLAKACAKRLKEIYDGQYDFSAPQDEREKLREQQKVAQAATFATATLSELKKIGWFGVPDYELAKVLIPTFQPEWIDEWAEWTIENNPRHFSMIRKLSLEGLCKKPESENYILGMIVSLGQRSNQSVLDTFLESPAMIESDLWRVFEVEGNGEFSLASSDKYTFQEENTWAYALKALSEKGLISREKLLADSLDTLAKDFAQFRAGWFSRFHESLAPSVEERSELLDKYLLLLGSQIPPTVSFAIKALVKIEKSGSLPAEKLLASIAPTLEAKTKATVTAALKLLTNTGKKQQELSGEIARLSANALLHESTDVQSKALDVIDLFGNEDDEQLCDVLLGYSDLTAPSLRPRLEKWIGKDSNPVETIEETRPATSDTIFEPQNIEPVSSASELIELLSSLLEDTTNPIEIERALDGVSRYASEDGIEFQKQVGPLVKRTKSILKRGTEDLVKYDLCLLSLSFATKENQFKNFLLGYYDKDDRATFDKVFYQHTEAIAQRIAAKKDADLLSTPTHGRGFLDPTILVERFKRNQQRSIESSLIDMVIAILRLDSKRHVDMSVSPAPPHEFIDALRYALGEEITIGKTAALWIAAARIRNPGGDSEDVIKKHGRLGPDAGACVKFTTRVEESSSDTYTWHYLIVDHEPKTPNKVPVEHITVIPHGDSEYKFYWTSPLGNQESLVSWCSTIRPGNLNTFFADGVRSIDIDGSEVQWQMRAYFLPLLEPDVPLEGMALLLIACGLGCSEPGIKGLASEAFIMGIEDHRLDLDSLASEMAWLLPTGYIKPARWTKAFTSISQVSAMHAKAVRNLIPKLLRHSPEDAPRDLGGLLELLYELSIAANAPVIDQEALNYFQQNKKGGKQGKFSKKLLQLGS